MTDAKHPTREELRRRPVEPDADVKRRKWVRGFRAEEAYRQKCEDIKHGRTDADFVLFGGEMVRYLLEKQGIAERDFNQTLGFGPNYFRGNIFDFAWNNGDAALPEPFRKRMAELTRESLEKAGKDPITFWCKRNFTLADIEGLYIDMTRDIGDAKVQYPKSEPGAEVKSLLEKIPELAKTMLVIPATETQPSTWRHDTFLFDDQGKFRPVKTMPSIRFLVENPKHTPEEIIDTLTKRGPDDGYFYDKGQFMKQVLKAAKEQHLVTRTTEALRYIPLRAENSCAWSR